MQEPQQYIEVPAPLVTRAGWRVFDLFDPGAPRQPPPNRGALPEGFDYGMVERYLDHNQRWLLRDYGVLPIMGSLGMWVILASGFCLDPTGRGRCIHAYEERATLDGTTGVHGGPDVKMLALKLAIEADDRYVDSIAG